jgi:hypothetical protein
MRLFVRYTDKYMATDNTKRKIIIWPPWTPRPRGCCPEPIIVYPEVIALFSFITTSIYDMAPMTVNLNNLSTNANSYYWNFGDGNASTSDSPTKTYITGSYIITLDATGSGINNVDQYSQSVNIITIPPPDIWLRSDSGIVTSGSNVIQWQDQSGNGYHFNQTESQFQPTITSSYANGHSAVAFSHSYLYGPPMLQWNQPVSIFVALQWDILDSTHTGSGVLIRAASLVGASTNGIFIYKALTPANSGYIRWNGGFGPTVKHKKPIHQSFVFSGSVSEVRSNTASLNQATSVTMTTHSFEIGGPSGSVFLGEYDFLANTQIMEILIYRSVFTGSQNNKIENYLAHKYNIQY